MPWTLLAYREAVALQNPNTRVHYYRGNPLIAKILCVTCELLSDGGVSSFYFSLNFLIRKSETYVAIRCDLQTGSLASSFRGS